MATAGRVRVEVVSIDAAGREEGLMRRAAGGGGGADASEQDRAGRGVATAGLDPDRDRQGEERSMRRAGPGRAGEEGWRRDRVGMGGKKKVGGGLRGLAAERGGGGRERHRRAKERVTA